jgi:hypothetical protein
MVTTRGLNKIQNWSHALWTDISIWKWTMQFKIHLFISIAIDSTRWGILRARGSSHSRDKGLLIYPAMFGHVWLFVESPWMRRVKVTWLMVYIPGLFTLLSPLCPSPVRQWFVINAAKISQSLQITCAVGHRKRGRYESCDSMHIIWSCLFFFFFGIIHIMDSFHWGSCQMAWN